MVTEAPPFWWRESDWRAWLLLPFSSAYGAVARHRLVNAPRHPVDAPVLCVGNLTVGGSGKTPLAIALANHARGMMLKPGFLSRGHGGSVGAPHLVDADHDSARHVGDEPLLLARAAPTAVTADRRAGAELLLSEGCDFIIMDDGFQSARIHIDYSLIVVDARRGIGNGHVIPAGPMRAALVDQMRFADGVLRLGEGEAAEKVIRHASRAGRPVYDATIRAAAPPAIAGRGCLAFAGIGDPQKFFDTVANVGARAEITSNFPDHHFYSDYDIEELVQTAEARDLLLATTAKDAARLAHGSEAMEEFRRRLHVIDVEVTFEVDQTPRTIIEDTLAEWRRRRLRQT